MNYRQKIIDRCIDVCIEETVDGMYADYGRTVKEELELYDTCYGYEIPKDCLKKIIEKNNLVCIHAYPDTEVGQIWVVHHDIDLALKECWESIAKHYGEVR